MWLTIPSRALEIGAMKKSKIQWVDYTSPVIVLGSITKGLHASSSPPKAITGLEKTIVRASLPSSTSKSDGVKDNT